MKIVELAEKAKLASLIREKTRAMFDDWKPLVDYFCKTEKNYGIDE